MSVTYRLVGERRLRKYTEASASPVYATESEVSFISSHLCDVPWTPANGVRDARMTWHTGENVGDAEHPVSGLDRNVEIRDQFDAALFCSDHVGGAHKAHANAACYHYVLPDAAVGKTLQRVVASVTSDPYNAVGARLALLTNTSGEVPTDCAVCRNGGRFVNGSYAQDASYHTADGGVVKRRVETAADGSQTWYPKTEDVALEPTGFVLQKHLFVFVLLENYNFCRGNWIEGSSFIENRISVTLSQAVDGWTEGSVIDLDGSVPADGFVVSVPESGAVRPQGSEVCVFEASASGHLFPSRRVVSDGRGLGHFSSTPSVGRLWTDLPVDGRCGSVTMLDISPYGRYSGSSFQVQIRRQVYAVFHPGIRTPGFVPGVELFLTKWSSGTRPEPGLPTSEAEVDAVPVTVVGTVPEHAAQLPAYRMLAEGTAAFVAFDSGSPAYHPTIEVKEPEPVPSLGFWLRKATVPVVVCGPLGIYLLGYLAYDLTYVSNSSVTGDPSLVQFFYADSVSGAVDLSGGLARPVSAYFNHPTPAPVIGNPPYEATFDSEAGTVTLAPSGVSWMRSNVRAVSVSAETSGGVLLKRGTDSVFCAGTGIEIVPDPWKTQDAFIVRGSLSSVGGVSCSSAAVVVFGNGDPEVRDVDDILADHAFSGGVVRGVGLVGFSEHRGIVVSGTFGSVDGVSGFGGTCVLMCDPLSPPAEWSPARIPGFEFPSETEVISTFSCNSDITDMDGMPKFALSAAAPELRRLYESTPYDAQLLEDGSRPSSLGLRNCYGNVYAGSARDVLATPTVEGAAFSLSRGVVLMNLTSDGGITAETVAFPVWRIAVSSLLVPTSLPVSFSPASVRLAFGTVGTAGNCEHRVNVWVKPGVRETGLGELAADGRLYDATVREVSGWTLVGTVPVVSGSVRSLALPGCVAGHKTATFLVTAWIPQDSFNPDDPLDQPRRIGTLAFDAYGNLTGLGGGIRPSISLMP